MEELPAQDPHPDPCGVLLSGEDMPRWKGPHVERGVVSTFWELLVSMWRADGFPSCIWQLNLDQVPRGERLEGLRGGLTTQGGEREGWA